MRGDEAIGTGTGGGEETARRPPHRPTPFQRRLPNALTIGRVVMTVAFVAVLSVYRFPDHNAWALPTALVLFVVAALTDAADGYLARRWNAITVFGRIVDPLADKVLILGAFIMLAGPGFWVDREFAYGGHWVAQTTGIAPWMAVVILGREFLVTTIRAVFEGRGVDFSAALSGKLKMILQAVGAPAIMLGVLAAAGAFGEVEAMRDAILAAQDGDGSLNTVELWTSSAMWWERYFRISVGVCAAIAWCVTLVTAASAIPYVTRAIRAGSEARA